MFLGKKPELIDPAIKELEDLITRYEKVPFKPRKS